MTILFLISQQMQTDVDKWTSVWLPGIGMGIALGLLFVGFILIRSKMLRASENSKKALEELEAQLEDDNEGDTHDEDSG